jgi:predicted nucleic acid-binding protein
MDLWIAATALAHKLPLYTRNGEAFRLLHEILEVRTL